MIALSRKRWERPRDCYSGVKDHAPKAIRVIVRPFRPGVWMEKKPSLHISGARCAFVRGIWTKTVATGRQRRKFFYFRLAVWAVAAFSFGFFLCGLNELGQLAQSPAQFQFGLLVLLVAVFVLVCCGMLLWVLQRLYRGAQG